MCNLLPPDNHIFPNRIHHEGAVAYRVNGKHNKRKHSCLIELQSKLHTLVDCTIVRLSLTLQFCQISFKDEETLVSNICQREITLYHNVST